MNNLIKIYITLHVLTFFFFFFSEETEQAKLMLFS